MFSPSITVVEKASMRTQSNEHDLKFSFAVRIPNSGNVWWNPPRMAPVNCFWGRPLASTGDVLRGQLELLSTCDHNVILSCIKFLNPQDITNSYKITLFHTNHYQSTMSLAQSSIFSSFWLSIAGVIAVARAWISWIMQPLKCAPSRVSLLMKSGWPGWKPPNLGRLWPCGAQKKKKDRDKNSKQQSFALQALNHFNPL